MVSRRNAGFGAHSTLALCKQKLHPIFKDGESHHFVTRALPPVMPGMRTTKGACAAAKTGTVAHTTTTRYHKKESKPEKGVSGRTVNTIRSPLSPPFAQAHTRCTTRATAAAAALTNDDGPRAKDFGPRKGDS